jgi:Ni,Fe-hydrogenase III component G
LATLHVEEEQVTVEFHEWLSYKGEESLFTAVAYFSLTTKPCILFFVFFWAQKDPKSSVFLLARPCAATVLQSIAEKNAANNLPL